MASRATLEHALRELRRDERRPMRELQGVKARVASITASLLQNRAPRTMRSGGPRSASRMRSSARVGSRAWPSSSRTKRADTSLQLSTRTPASTVFAVKSWLGHLDTTQRYATLRPRTTRPRRLDQPRGTASGQWFEEEPESRADSGG